jgi:hypothetical protein
VLTHAEYVGATDELASDQAWSEPAWYAVDLNGIVAGPFDSDGECDWWLSKCHRV